MAREKPIPRKHRSSTSRGNLNRGRQYRRDVDNVPDVSISLMDLDSAIMHYFTEVIKPTVIEDGETVKVPVMYSSPERWFAIQKSGFMRDKKRQLILPAIAFRRTGMTKDETIPLDTMDPEEPKLHWQFERKWTDQNRYDNFSVQQGIMPQREYYNVAVPDFMVLTYDFMIWTHYIEQMNKIVERINWSEGAYWGEPGKMKFRTSIDSFTDNTDVTERERIVRTEFSVTLKGYLIPEAFNELAGPHTMQKYLTPKTLTIGAETDVSVASIVKQDESVQEVRISGGTSAPGLRRTQQPLILKAGSGITLSNDNVEWVGDTRLVQTITSTGASGTGGIFVATGSAYSTTNALQITGSLVTTGALTIGGNAVIQGDLTAQSYNSEIVSSSIIYDSGSTKFGDDISDTHQMTGSVSISGSLLLNGTAIGTTVTTFDEYTRKQFVKRNTTLIGNSTASFSAVTASAPSGMTSTSEEDFLFFLNGQYMEHDALTIQQANGAFYLKVDTNSIGYVLESDDEIIAWGKFNA